MKCVWSVCGVCVGVVWCVGTRVCDGVYHEEGRQGPATFLCECDGNRHSATGRLCERERGTDTPVDCPLSLLVSTRVSRDSTSTPSVPNLDTSPPQ